MCHKYFILHDSGIIQPCPFAYIHLLNRYYVNRGTLRGHHRERKVSLIQACDLVVPLSLNVSQIFLKYCMTMALYSYESLLTNLRLLNRYYVNKGNLREHKIKCCHTLC